MFISESQGLVSRINCLPHVVKRGGGPIVKQVWHKFEFGFLDYFLVGENFSFLKRGDMCGHCNYTL